MESFTVDQTIDQSIQCLKDHLLSCVDQGIVSHSAVKVYASSMHLLYEIKKEQLYVAQYRYVINNALFFQILPKDPDLLTLLI